MPIASHYYDAPFTPTPGQFQFWLDTGLAGEEIVYHTGNLMVERGHADLAGRTASEVADMAWQAYEEGEVVLVQRRAGPGAFDYLARKISHRWA